MPEIRLAAVSKAFARSFDIIDTDPHLEDAVFHDREGEIRAICSRCERVIGEDLRGLPIVPDTAVVCPNCRVHLRLDKASPYGGWLPMLADARGSEAEAMAIPEADTNRWHKSGLSEVTEKALAPLVAYQSSTPSVLYHYTTRSGLLGIIGSGTLWASDLAYMNDASEAKYGQDLLRDLVRLGYGHLSEMMGGGPEHFASQAQHRPPATSQHIICFCEDGDLLSQWRSYGTDGGFAVALWTNSMRRHTLRRIVYDRDVQNTILFQILDTASDYLHREGFSHASRPRQLVLQDWLNQMLSAALLSFKHSSFAEEREWRLIEPVHPRRDVDRIQFRQSGSLVVPYTAVQINDRLSEAPPIPVVSVTCGPSANPELSFKSAELLLQRHNYDHVEVISTAAPLRV